MFYKIPEYLKWWSNLSTWSKRQYVMKWVDYQTYASSMSEELIKKAYDSQKKIQYSSGDCARNPFL